VKRGIASLLIVLCLSACLSVSVLAQSADDSSASGISDFFTGIKTAIQKHLGRPYVWGASGMKSFDCSGFVWRVMYENGILMKRTTARKFYMMLKPVPKEAQGNFGTLVFFDDLKHIGIVDTPQTFYHAQVTLGTNRSPMNAFWKKKVYGYRQLPIPEK
jgi:cell wall-associated NlpC family hydrolase